jgi:predicted Fe-Mo cluster-binding NifX family protein
MIINIMSRIFFRGGRDTMKIAFPVEKGLICPHFGHAPEFVFVEIKDGVQGKRETETPPKHEPGVLPRWLKENGTDVLVSGGLGSRASEILVSQGIQVITGITGPIDQAIAKLVDGELKGTGSLCSHDHGDCDH